MFLFKEDTFVFVLDTQSILFWINVFRLYEHFQRFNMVCIYFNNNLYIAEKINLKMCSSDNISFGLISRKSVMNEHLVTDR